MQESQNVPAPFILILFCNGLEPGSEVRPGGDQKPSHTSNECTKHTTFSRIGNRKSRQVVRVGLERLDPLDLVSDHSHTEGQEGQVVRVLLERLDDFCDSRFLKR